MVWKKVEKAVGELPAQLLTVTGTTQPKLQFPVRAMEKINLPKYHSADIYLDDKSPELMALQLYENGDGAYRIGYRKQTAVISASRALRQAGARPGAHYQWRRDADGFIIIDFSHPVTRKDWKKLRL